MIYRLPLALAAAFLLAWQLRFVQRAGVRVATWLESRHAPLAIGVVTAIMLTLAWGSWTQIPVIHDEASYLFQAKLFASGHWTAPSPPAPEFFEQWHVFVVPHYASKYPPGHALLLVPGIWLGLPGMMPVIISAITAALVFSVARRLTNGVIAFWTWGWWITTSIVLWLLASYFSQPTSALCWMLGWYALLRWRDGGERWLYVVAASVGWLGLTRPLTALAYAIPVGVYVLWRVKQRRQWATLGGPMVLGLALLLVIPLWSWKTVDSATKTPYALYSEMYFPWDAPGFGLDSSPPKRALPPDMAIISKYGSEPHRYYVPSALPRVFAERAFYVAKDMWGPPRTILAVFAAIGLLAITAELAFGLASALVLLVAYLWFDHGAGWTVYYLEIQPVLAVFIALGFWRVMNLWPRDVAGSAARSPRTRAVAPIAAGMSMLIMLFLADFAKVMVFSAHRNIVAVQRYQRTFLSAIARLPADKAIVFVRYGPDHNPHLSLLYNDPDLPAAKRWIVYDRGPDNVRLMQAAPERAAFLYDESRNAMYPFVPARDTVAAQITGR
ncbi:MAG: ArnT family glycosyltransferase [Gemmatimonadaceae bacterium]